MGFFLVVIFHVLCPTPLLPSKSNQLLRESLRNQEENVKVFIFSQ